PPRWSTGCPWLAPLHATPAHRQKGAGIPPLAWCSPPRAWQATAMPQTVNVASPVPRSPDASMPKGRLGDGKVAPRRREPAFFTAARVRERPDRKAQTLARKGPGLARKGLSSARQQEGSDRQRKSLARKAKRSAFQLDCPAFRPD